MSLELSFSNWRAYMQLTRLDKPIGIYLLLWPTIWALVIAADGLPSLGITLIFIAGVVLMRSAGCVINDYADRKVDGSVKRTNARPLVSGTVTEREALQLFALADHCLVGCGAISGGLLSVYEAIYAHAASGIGGCIWLGDPHGVCRHSGLSAAGRLVAIYCKSYLDHCVRHVLRHGRPR